MMAAASLRGRAYETFPRLSETELTVTDCRMVMLHQTPLEAINAPRLHHQLLPDKVMLERWDSISAHFAIAADVENALRSRGHETAPTEWGAACQVVMQDPDAPTLFAASDPRKDGAPAGL